MVNFTLVNVITLYAQVKCLLSRSQLLRLGVPSSGVLNNHQDTGMHRIREPSLSSLRTLFLSQQRHDFLLAVTGEH